MTHTELTNDLTYIAGEEMLQRLMAKSALTEEEAWQVRKELNRRLRPTIVFILRSYTDVIKENV